MPIPPNSFSSSAKSEIASVTTLVDMSFWLTVTKLLASRKKQQNTSTTLIRDIPT